MGSRGIEMVMAILVTQMADSVSTYGMLHNFGVRTGGRF
jgi:hypothetical protein